MSKNRIADQVADLLEQRLASGYWPIGSRLTAERQLAEELQVSRSSLREALQQLISKGLLASRVGGGTYVVSTKPVGFVDPMLALFKENPEYRFDVLEIRHALEGNAAWYAALRATEEDKAHIQTCFERMIQLHGKGNPLEEAQADAAFHLAIAEASHNLVLLHVMRSLFDLLQNSISHSLDKLYTLPRIFESLIQQHHSLMDAILAGNSEAALQAAQHHLTFVEDSIKDLDAEEARKIRSLRRLTITGV